VPAPTIHGFGGDLVEIRSAGAPQPALRTEASAQRIPGRWPRSRSHDVSGLFAMSVEFTKEETAALIQLLVGTIERHPFPQSRDIQRLRDILRKIRPNPELPSNGETEEDA